MPNRPQDAGRPGEFELIARLFAPLAAGFPDACGLLDDVAYLPLRGGLVRPGEELVLKTDALVEGVHFLVEDPAELVARKLLRINLSDLAAKGARPLVYTLTLLIPAETAFSWLESFAAGLGADQAAFGVHLVGGDTDSTPGPLALSLTVVGAIPAGARLLRGAARPGDAVFVSGTIGDGALGLKAIRGELGGLGPEERAYLAGRYRLPQPRLALGAGLRGLAHATMDVSDGLVGDLQHICEASRVAALIEAERIPLSEAGRAALAAEPGLLASVLGGGDDYELLFTAEAGREAALADLGRSCGVPVTRIGWIEPGAGVQVRDAQGREIRLTQTGYRHF